MKAQLKLGRIFGVASPDAAVTEALEMMAHEDLNELPIIADGELAGFISRAHILQLLQTRVQLHV